MWQQAYVRVLHNESRYSMWDGMAASAAAPKHCLGQLKFHCDQHAYNHPMPVTGASLAGPPLLGEMQD